MYDTQREVIAEARRQLEDGPMGRSPVLANALADHLETALGEIAELRKRPRKVTMSFNTELRELLDEYGLPLGAVREFEPGPRTLVLDVVEGDGTTWRIEAENPKGERTAPQEEEDPK